MLEVEEVRAVVTKGKRRPRSVSTQSARPHHHK